MSEPLLAHVDGPSPERWSDALDITLRAYMAGVAANRRQVDRDLARLVVEGALETDRQAVRGAPQVFYRRAGGGT